MMLLLAFSVPSTDNLGEFALRGLAVAGGAFVGGFGIGLLTQLLSRAMTTRPVPPRALRVVRVLGGLTAGVLAAMVMFGSGGGGWGFGGGPGSGSGTGNGDGQAQKDGSLKDAVVQDKLPPKDAEVLAKKTSLRIEVFGDKSEKRFYRIEGEAKVQTLAEVSAILPKRREQEPTLQKVVIVLYQNSPDQMTPVVRDLVRLIEANGLTPDLSLDPGYAP